MSEQYTAEFKAKVALEAVTASKSVVKEIAEKHNVTEEEVIRWAQLLQDEAANVFGASTTESSHADVEEGENVEISTDDEDLAAAITHGVMSDNLNYGKLIFWSSFGTALVIIFVIALVYYTQYSVFETQKRVSEQSTYMEIQQLEATQNAQLNSFGVVDLDEGVYHIPIDSAIARIAEDQ